ACCPPTSRSSRGRRPKKHPGPPIPLMSWVATEMGRLLLNLRMVPDDESREVREMLDTAGIEFYETTPSRWGISHGGIWVTHESDLARAKALMADYQRERQRRARTEQEAAVREGRAERFMDVVRGDPLRVLFTAAAIVVLLLLVALPAI